MPDSKTPSRPAGAPAPVTAADVADGLRRQIQDGLLPPGEWLRENRVCTQFGVGRSLARTALRTLADDGLVIIEENRGAYVAATTVQEVFDRFLFFFHVKIDERRSRMASARDGVYMRR